MSVLPLAFLGFGLLFVVIGVVTVVNDRRRRRDWQRYPGRVVASRLDEGKFQSQVAYLHHGREVTFWNRFSSTTLTDPVGRTVEVLVNPDDPHDAVVSGVLPGGAVVGSLLVLVGAVAAVLGASWLR